MPTILNFDAYFNLHQHVWSIKDRSTGTVASHATEMLLHDVDFVVQPAGNRRANEEGRKNVHAFARTQKGATLQPGRGYDVYKAAADIAGVSLGMPYTGVPISYNPYKADFFYSTDFGWEVTGAEFVRLGVTEDDRPICIGFGLDHGTRTVEL